MSDHDPYMALGSAPEPRDEQNVADEEPETPDAEVSGFNEDTEELLAGSASDVLERVGDDVEKARVALAAEQKSDKPRKGLSNSLAELIAESENDSK